MSAGPERKAAAGDMPAVAALEYAGYGWPVFPVHTATNGVCSCANPDCERAAKHPRTRRGFKDASVDTDAISAWWDRWPGSNLGIATGAAGLLVLDVDPRHDGDETLHEHESRHGPLPVTPSVVTGSGGQHYYFASPGGIGNSPGALGDGLDIRAEGAYAVAPPSVHLSGRKYEWDHPPDEVAVAAPPGWLLELIVVPRDQGHKARSVSEWRKLAAEGATPGERNNKTAQLAGHLLARDVDPFVCLELCVAWDERRNKPPLGRDEITRTVASIARRELARWNR